MTNIKRLTYALLGCSLLFLLAAGPAKAGTCPAIGWTSDCNLLITIGTGLSVSTSNPSGVSNYDGVEDQLVGVTNTSGVTITSIFLSGSNIFGFDGDGAGEPGTGCLSVGGAPNPCFSGGPFGPTGYEGPGTSFTITDANTGVVNFLNGGLKDGQSLWFSLEEPASPGSITSIKPGVAPEPASLLLLGTGLVGLALRRFMA